jgi:hypothetical protein
MFSLQVVDTDAFLDMPQSSQLLYFHLSMRADDDGFVSSPKKIMRTIGCQDDDLKVLITKRFILPFESGVCVIKHWRIHNLIRADRYNETQWVEEKEKLFIDSKTKKYSLKQEHKGDVIPNGNQMATQVRLGKVRLGEREDSKFPISFLKDLPKEDIERYANKYNCTKKQVEEKAEAIINYCKSKGKTYKDYNAVMHSWLLKDYGLRSKISNKKRNLKPYKE